MNTHEELRNILMAANCPEYGDVIIDDICHLFNFPDTNQTESKQ